MRADGQAILHTMLASENPPNSGALALEIADALSAKKDLLLADMWTGFQIAVEGHPKSVDVLLELLKPHIDVRSIRVWSGEKQEYTTKLNYTELKGLRS